MKTISRGLIILCLLLLGAAARESKGAGEAAPVKARVKALLDVYARADDLLDDRFLAKRAELEALGEHAYPALCELLTEVEDPRYLGSLINVFLRSNGDKTEPVEQVSRFLTTRRDGRYAGAQSVGLVFLGEHGSAAELPIVGEYARAAGGKGIRIIAEKAKAQIEKRVEHERAASREAAEMRTKVKTLLEGFARADGLVDETALAKRAELEALGAKAYPVLCEILEESADPNYLARIVDVFSRSDGDKARPLEAVRELLMTRREERFIPAQQEALHLLAEHGLRSDIPLIKQYASTGFEGPRAVALQAEKSIETRTAQQRIPRTPQRSNETSKATNSPTK